MPNAIDDAVRGAVKEELEKVVPQKEEAQKQEATSTIEETKTEVSPEDKKTQEALSLWNALSDPKLAAGIIKEMAQAAGLEVTTKQEQKVVVKDVLEILKDSLPEEQKFLAESMGPAIKKMVEEIVNNQTAELKARAEEAQVIQAKNEVEGTFSKLEKRYPDIKKYEGEMNKLADKFALTPGTSLEDYIEGLYVMATKDVKEAKSVERTVKQITRNAGKAMPASAQVDDTTVNRGSKLPTLKEAIDAAKQGIRLH